jgi:esterase/lipase
MKQNMGNIDRGLRAAVALVIAGLYFGGILSGTVAIALGVVGIVMLATSLVGSCPAYIPFKLNTKGK